MKKKFLIPIILTVLAFCIVIAYFLLYKSNEVTASNNNITNQLNQVNPSGNNITNQSNQVNPSGNNITNQSNQVTSNNTNQSNETTKNPNLSNTKQEIKSITKKDAVSLILKNELLNQQLPKYFIPITALKDNYKNLEKVNDSNVFLCNDDNKLDNGVLVELPNFNENNQTNYFIIKDYDSIKNGGKGLIDKGTISNTGEVKFTR